ncbi:MAG: leucine-rich repeat domain-containing protein [Phycisphaerae bacterium]|nr:leucine-rich repeat domain-containing protein [Phycisphaerae bacterium]
MTKYVSQSIIAIIAATIMLALTSCDSKSEPFNISSSEDVAQKNDTMTLRQQAAYDKALLMIKQAKVNKANMLNIFSIDLTKVPNEISQLYELKELYISCNPLLSLPLEIGNLTALRSCFITYNDLIALPPEIGQLSNLEELSFTGNSLNYLPAEIGELSNLEFLYLDDNNLTSLPEEIRQLTNLRILDLSNNKLTILPRWITEMDMNIRWGTGFVVKGINLYGNPLQEPPIDIVMQGKEAIKQYFADKEATAKAGDDVKEAKMIAEERAAYDKALSEIKKAKDENAIYLWLHEIPLSKLPPEIGELIWLEKLFIFKTELSSLPPEIGQLTALKQLAVHDNQLTGLPKEIGQLNRLEIFSVEDNRLTCLPAEIGKLTALQELRLCNNKLNSIPDQISQLANLRCLDLRGNELKSLPGWITEMDMKILWGEHGNFKGINLYGNPLQEPPIEIVKQGRAAIKQYFGIDDAGFPASIVQRKAKIAAKQQMAYDKALKKIKKAKAENVTTLYLSGMDLIKLPAEIGELTELEKLVIFKTELSSLPPQIGKLTALKNLDVSFNQLTCLPPEIGQLSNLETLFVEDSNLTCLPAEIEKLSNLQELMLSNNKLTSLPEEITRLTNLKRVHLLNNKLKTLPVWITEMDMAIIWDKSDASEAIFLYGNPLEEPPIEIVKQGNAAIRRYFEDKGEGKPRE